MAVDKGKFTVLNDEGKEIKCEVLFTFESDETHKNYIVYTDNTLDTDGSTKVYASTYDPDGIDSSLKPIKSDKEWKIIETILEELQEAVKEEPDNSKIGIEDKPASEENDEASASEDGIPWEDIFADFPSFTDTKISKSFDELAKHIEEEKKASNGILDERTLGDVIDALENESVEDHIDYLFGILDDNAFSDGPRYLQLGMTAYSSNRYITAEEAFRRAVTLNPEVLGGRNNLAYLIRRNEVRNPQKTSGKEIVELLKPGVANKETFSLINMALFWALRVGSEEDWKMADELISLVSKSDVHGAYLWWLDVGNKDDVEGHLVHLLLIRNGKIAKSPLGEMKVLFDKVKSQYAAIPAEFQNIVTPFNGGTTDTLPCLDDWL